MKQYYALLSIFIFSLISPSLSAEDNYLPSLITDTPFEGRQLAIKLARKSIGEMQSDPAIKKEVRATYARDGAALIAAAEVIAIEFSTIAAANNYWRKSWHKKFKEKYKEGQHRQDPKDKRQ